MQTVNREHYIHGAKAECYITLNGNRYRFASISKFEGTIKVELKEIPCLGSLVKKHKPGKIKLEWKGTAAYNSSIMREVMREYKNTGIMPGFDIQVTNEDPASAVGRQTVIFKDCLTEGGTLAKFDESAEFLDEELKGVANDFETPEKFNLIEGMM